ncbi:hypothetical protein [Algoriphagus aestuariicola]|nr:hypothetical protein [Algoriphagus aestuariicola]
MDKTTIYLKHFDESKTNLKKFDQEIRMPRRAWQLKTIWPPK